jgi:WhiB family redox-sensing transcriptional regulator
MPNYNWKRSKPTNSHCPKGHEFTLENTFIRAYDNARVCKECRRLYARNKYQKNKLKNGGIARPKKDVPVQFDLPESAKIQPKAEKLWYTLQESLSVNKTPCQIAGPRYFTDEAQNISDDTAEQMCHGCPLLKQCYDFAVANNEPWGIWGGINFSKGDDDTFTN